MGHLPVRRERDHQQRHARRRIGELWPAAPERDRQMQHGKRHDQHDHPDQ